MSRLKSSIGLFAVLAAGLVALALLIPALSNTPRDQWVPISQVVDDVRAGKIDKITVASGDNRVVVLAVRRDRKLAVPYGPSLAIGALITVLTSPAVWH